MLEYKEWDSTFFSLKIYKYILNRENNQIIDINYFAQTHRVDLIECILDYNNTKIGEISKTFRFIDNYINLQINLTNNIRKLNIISDYETTKIEDYKDIKCNIDDDIFHFSRFNFHPFSIGDSSKLYKTWIDKSIKGLYDHKCIHIKSGNKIAGVSTYKIESGILVIGLFFVFPEFQGKGISRLLIQALFNEGKMNRVENISVKTQGCNTKAINFYLHNGFLTNQIQSLFYWYK